MTNQRRWINTKLSQYKILEFKVMPVLFILTVYIKEFWGKEQEFSNR